MYFQAIFRSLKIMLALHATIHVPPKDEHKTTSRSLSMVKQAGTPRRIRNGKSHERQGSHETRTQGRTRTASQVMMRRTPLRRTAFRRCYMPMKRTPIRRVSKRHARLMRIYKKVRAEVMAEHPVCQCCGSNPSTECHHMKGRGKYLLVKKWMKSLCTPCHWKVTRKPKWAKRKGLTVLRY